jgi:hypothetical protein
VSNTASNFGSGVTTGINYLGTGINYLGTGISTGVKTIASPGTYIYSMYRKYYRPIAEVEREYNVSITNHIPSKPFIEQTVSATANSSFLYSGEQFRQLLGDYAIMDTTYTMSVTKYVFDFNTYVIKNMGNSDKLKSAVPSNVTDANQILDAVVATKNSESEITTQLKQKIAVMLYPLLAEEVYNDIFGSAIIKNISEKVYNDILGSAIKNRMSLDNRDNDDNEKSDFTPSTSVSSTPRSASGVDKVDNELINLVDKDDNFYPTN